MQLGRCGCRTGVVRLSTFPIPWQYTSAFNDWGDARFAAPVRAGHQVAGAAAGFQAPAPFCGLRTCGRVCGRLPSATTSMKGQGPTSNGNTRPNQRRQAAAPPNDPPPYLRPHVLALMQARFNSGTTRTVHPAACSQPIIQKARPAKAMRPFMSPDD